jgi:lysozyme family protein
MPTVRLSPALRDEYQRLFDTCQVRPEKAAEVEATAERVNAGRVRYEAVAGPLGIPWHLVGVIHSMEASGNFGRHLHNGDPLTARTVQVPAGRPKDGTPPFTWEQSAADALRLKGLDRWTDWAVPALLYKIEEYNGWGYRLYHPHVLAPYLWSGSNHYSSGKYVADGRWSDTAVSGQIGAAVLLRRLAERNLVALGAPAAPVAEEAPLLRYAPGEARPEAERLQKFLNQFEGVYLKEDGKAGEKTSDAFRAVSGHYLHGDPRA